MPNEAERLLDPKVRDYKSCRDLAIEGLKLPPGVLAQRFRDRLQVCLTSAEEVLGSTRPPPPPPR